MPASFSKVLKERAASSRRAAWFVLNSPELGKPLEEFCEACADGGVLDKKTKELLMVAVASVFRCSACTEAHIEGALEAGASREEVTEALLVAAVEGAASQLAWNKELFVKYLSVGGGTI